MIIGIKYCGGCNPGYQREFYVNKLKKCFPEHCYVTLNDKKVCDVWLAVCGCSAACAANENLIALKRRFVLTSMKEFVEAEDYLRAVKKEKEDDSVICSVKGGCSRYRESHLEEQDAAGIRHLHIGETASVIKTFYKEDADKFSLLTGDRNRLHTAGGFSEQLRFGRPVVHGVLTASLISTVMGTKLPGDGTVLMSENLDFVNPVYFGDTVEAMVTFVSFRETKRFYVGEFYGECRNQRGETVVTGTARQLMMKTLFQVEEGGKKDDEY